MNDHLTSQPGTSEPRARVNSSTSLQTSPRSDYKIRCARLPLSVYREIEAHLRQVDGVNAGLLPQTSQEFDYLMSQIGGIWISYQPNIDATAQQRVEDILEYYSNRFGAWEVIYSES